MDLSITDIIRGRRTIGAFRPEVPPVHDVENAIELARWAPNHKKTEPWRVYWLGPETARQVIDLNSTIIATNKGQAEAD